MTSSLTKVALALPAVDLILILFVLPAALVLKLYRRFGSVRVPLTTSVLKRFGVFPVRNHYHEPLFDDRRLTKPLSAPRALPGIDFKIEEQLELL